MSLYAWDEGRNKDASGSSSELLIGGTEVAAEPDNESPEITMYLNDESFQNGTSVGSSSVLFAKISDENGITTTGNGLIQGITLDLNGETINLNEFYSSDSDTYQSGTVVYPIQDLSPGIYTASLKVYDTYNNLSDKKITFTVIDGSFISVLTQKHGQTRCQARQRFRLIMTGKKKIWK